MNMKAAGLLIALSIIRLNALSQYAPVGIIEDLKTAYNGESTATAKYAEFSEAARKEGYLNIALMFEATSKAEAIHAKNHQAVLEKLGVKLAGPVIEVFRIGTTDENLDDGIKGETREHETLYPPMIKAAEKAGIFDAVTTFRYAKDTEKRHRVFYEQAQKAIYADDEKSLPSVWHVCPTCGNTYSPSDLPVSCEFCGTLRPRFIIFK